MQRRKAPRDEARRRGEGGEAEEQVQAKALDDQDDDDGAAVDLRPPADGPGGDMGAEGLERLAILLYPLVFAALLETSHSGCREDRPSAQK